MGHNLDIFRENKYIILYASCYIKLLSAKKSLHSYWHIIIVFYLWQSKILTIIIIGLQVYCKQWLQSSKSLKTKKKYFHPVAFSGRRGRLEIIPPPPINLLICVFVINITINLNVLLVPHPCRKSLMGTSKLPLSTAS